ncbi:hypothetical protein JW905_18830 [bacterium]|nr:hypothetical protein [candidate division CSSED10-310 bacterium]
MEEYTLAVRFAKSHAAETGARADMEELTVVERGSTSGVDLFGFTI